MNDGDLVGRWALPAVLVIVGAVLAAVLSGCTLTHNDSSLALMQLAPGEDVQSSTATVVGVEAMPLGVDGPVLRLGYVRSQRSRVPGYDKDTTMPYVRIETKVDGNGALVGESLEVNDEAPPAKGWFSGR